MKTQLPPGPRMPATFQTLGQWSRPTAFLERCRARYGPRFTLRTLGQPPFVVISTPDEIKEMFTAPPDVLHPGEGARILKPIVGSNSVILLDEGPHLEQRKLMLPAFQGERTQRLTGVMEELIEREVSSWPLEQPLALHPHLQNLTLEIILRAVFGLEQGADLDELRTLLTEILAFGESPLSLIPFAHRTYAGRGPYARLQRSRTRADELIFELIEQRRAGEGEGEGEDVLAMLLGARHEDGSPMSRDELRDELMTVLVAGHETTASQLAWGFERLVREPRVLARLADELDGDSDEAYLTATIQEIMRCRPVLINAEPRLVKQPIEIGDFTYPIGVILFANAYLLHHDPQIYPNPYAFRPERFLENPPGTYTWIPFGGGRRRCLGANFALLEMKLVLRAVLERLQPRAASAGFERARRRGIAVSPAHGARIVLHKRQIAHKPLSETPGPVPVAA